MKVNASTQTYPAPLEETLTGFAVPRQLEDVHEWVGRAFKLTEARLLQDVAGAKGRDLPVASRTIATVSEALRKLHLDVTEHLMSVARCLPMAAPPPTAAADGPPASQPRPRKTSTSDATGGAELASDLMSSQPRWKETAARYLGGDSAPANRHYHHVTAGSAAGGESSYRGDRSHTDDHQWTAREPPQLAAAAAAFSQRTFSSQRAQRYAQQYQHLLQRASGDALL